MLLQIDEEIAQRANILEYNSQSNPFLNNLVEAERGDVMVVIPSA